MMTGRERVIRALTFNCPDRAPRQVWPLPGVFRFRGEELRRLVEEYQPDITGPRFAYGKAEKSKGTPNMKGSYTDEWGCVWEVAEDGVIGEIKNPILADWSDLDKIKPPYEMLDTDWGIIDSTRETTDQFILAGTMIRPFERMQFIRGTENLFMDMAYGVPEFFKLRDMLHEFFMAELERWVERDVDGIFFLDDWGSQISLLISPDMWREYFKPLYKDYCDLIHKHGKYAFFHSDGYTKSIIPDLIGIGINALNTQIFCMDIEELAREFKGKITLWGEIDRQYLLPFGTPEEVKEGVRRVRRAFDDGRGGLIAQCEWGNKDPFENIKAVFEAWLEPIDSIR